MPVKPAKTEQIRSISPPKQDAPKADQAKSQPKAEQAKPEPPKQDAPKKDQATSPTSNPLQNTGQRVQMSGIDTNDPNIVALISFICMVLISAPGVGYVILGYTKKALIYTVGVWAAIFILAIGVFALSFVTMGFGSLCIFPLIILIFAIDIFIIYDVYCMAKGEKSKLPDF
jgi:fatty acid desaturase